MAFNSGKVAHIAEDGKMQTTFGYVRDGVAYAQDVLHKAVVSKDRSSM